MGQKMQMTGQQIYNSEENGQLFSITLAVKSI